MFHLREPVDDELVGLCAGQAELRKRVLQERGGLLAGDTEALREVILDVVHALPVEIAVGLAAFIGQRAVRRGGNAPRAVVGRIGAGQVARVVEPDGDVRFRLRVEIDDWFLRVLLFQRPAAGHGREQEQRKQQSKNSFHNKLPPILVSLRKTNLEGVRCKVWKI